jgi:hypothetical protein
MTPHLGRRHPIALTMALTAVHPIGMTLPHPPVNQVVTPALTLKWVGTNDACGAAGNGRLTTTFSYFQCVPMFGILTHNFLTHCTGFRGV